MLRLIFVENHNFQDYNFQCAHHEQCHEDVHVGGIGSKSGSWGVISFGHQIVNTSKYRQK